MFAKRTVLRASYSTRNCIECNRTVGTLLVQQPRSFCMLCGSFDAFPLRTKLSPRCKKEKEREREREWEKILSFSIISYLQNCSFYAASFALFGDYSTEWIEATVV